MAMLEFSGNTVDLVEYKQLWEANDRPTVVYLHNPFCMTYNNCFFAVIKGAQK